MTTIHGEVGIALITGILLVLRYIGRVVIAHGVATIHMWRVGAQNQGVRRAFVCLVTERTSLHPIGNEGRDFTMASLIAVNDRTITHVRVHAATVSYLRIQIITLVGFARTVVDGGAEITAVHRDTFCMARVGFIEVQQNRGEHVVSQ